MLPTLEDLFCEVHIPEYNVSTGTWAEVNEAQPLGTSYDVLGH